MCMLIIASKPRGIRARARAGLSRSGVHPTSHPPARSSQAPQSSREIQRSAMSGPLAMRGALPACQLRTQSSRLCSTSRASPVASMKIVRRGRVGALSIRAAPQPDTETEGSPLDFPEARLQQLLKRTCASAGPKLRDAPFGNDRSG